MDEPTAAEAPAEAADQPPASMQDALGADGQLIDEIEQSLHAEPAEGQAVAPMELEELAASNGNGPTLGDLELLADVAVEVAVEFGRTRLRLRELLTLRRGSLVALGRRPEEQVTVLANGTPIAYGDIVVVDDQVGVHIVELIDPPEGPGEPAPMAEVERGPASPAAAAVTETE